MSAVTVDSLAIEINSSAGNAVNGIEALTSTLEKLKTALKGGLGLNACANQLAKINTALDGVDGANTAKVEALATSLQKLAGLGQLKISSSIANQLTKIGTAAAGLDGVDWSGVEHLSSALAPLQDIESAGGLQSTITQLNRLPKVAEALNSVDWAGFASNIQTLTTILAPLPSTLDTVSASIGTLPSRIKQVTAATTNLAASNNSARTSYVNLWAKARMVMSGMTSASSFLAQAVKRSMTYQESLNVVNTALGEYAAAAKEYAEEVSNVMGIDPAEWLGYQGVFDTIVEGFGVSGDKAYTMSKNLTQLTYDLQSYYGEQKDTTTEEMFQKVQSAISGELEPLRNLGYDLSVARLEQEALNLGIEKSVSDMTQSEKAMLRYEAMLDQVSWVQGDMARTLDSTSNQMRVLQNELSQASRALGNVFIPVLDKVLPYLIAFVRLVREAITAIAEFFHISIAKSAESSTEAIGSVTSGIGDTTSALGDANKAASKLKNTIMSFDELHVMNSEDSGSSGSGSGSGGSVGGDLGIDPSDYDFLANAVDTKITEAMETLRGILKEMLPYVTAIGAAFAAWKIAENVLKFIDMVKGLGGVTTFTSGLLGLTMLMSDLDEFRKYVEDFMDNGATFQNVAGMISEFAGMLGDAFLVFGNIKIAGVLKIVQGLGEIAVAVKDIADNGINIDNAVTFVRGLSNLGIGIGLMTGNWKLVGVSVILQGILKIIPELSNILEAIKTGDWSGVDKVSLVVGALEILGGLVVALQAFGKIKGITDAAKASTNIQSLTTVSDSVNTSVSTGLSPTLKNLAGNLLLGVAIIAEVCAVALIVVGSIALLGMELGAVADAWGPVIENGGLVATACLLGVDVLAVVGTATYALGTTGSTTAINLGIGLAVLLEIGAAALLFEAEIWAVGEGLEAIGNAWEPVVNDGDTIKTGIITGTALLVGIGAAAAALGAVTIASAGSLPVAIGIGTAVLIELGVAAAAFIESISDVADQLSNNLAPALTRVNAKLPTLTANMHNFTTFMGDFATEVASYTKSSAGASFNATISAIVDAFTADPIDTLADAVSDVADQTTNLNTKLTNANAELKTAVDLLTDYQGFLGQIEALTQTNPSLSNAQFANMVEVGQKIVMGLTEGIQLESANFSAAVHSLMNDCNNTVASGWEQTRTGTQEKWEGISTDLGTRWADLSAAAGTTWEGLKTTVATGWESVQTNTGETWESVTGTLGTAWDGLTAAAGGTWDAMTSTIGAGWQNIQSDTDTRWSALKSTLGMTWDNLRNTAGTVWRNMQSNMQSTWQNVSANTRSVWQSLSASVQSTWSTMQSRAQSLMSGMYNTFWNQMNNIRSVMQSGLDALRGMLNFSWSLPHLSVPHFSISGSFSLNPPSVPSIDVSWYAAGGLPDAGELFMARESGPELVGRMGGSNAVANNDQIVEGIREGVQSANAREVELLRQQNELLRQLLLKETTVEVTAGAMSQALRRKNLRDGKVAVAVSG